MVIEIGPILQDFYDNYGRCLYNGNDFIQTKATNGNRIYHRWYDNRTLYPSIQSNTQFRYSKFVCRDWSHSTLVCCRDGIPNRKIEKIGKKALVIAFSEGLGTFAIGYFVCQALNYTVSDSLFLALAISVTSTVIVMRILEELDMIKEEATIIILGVAVIEDIIIISMLAIMQSVSSTGELSGLELITSVGTVLAFIGGALFIGSKTIPKLVNLIGKTNQHDVIVVAILGVAFGLSYIAFEIGISVATGAFFAGVLIAESKVHAVTQVLTTPLKDMFGALFFVSVGALMDITKLPLFISTTPLY